MDRLLSLKEKSASEHQALKCRNVNCRKGVAVGTPQPVSVLFSQGSAVCVPPLAESYVDLLQEEGADCQELAQ